MIYSPKKDSVLHRIFKSRKKRRILIHAEDMTLRCVSVGGVREGMFVWFSKIMIYIRLCVGRFSTDLRLHLIWETISDLQNRALILEIIAGSETEFLFS